MKFKLTYFLFLIGFSIFAQTEQEIEKEKAKDLTESTNLTWEANKEISEDNFVEGERDYRRAISKSADNVVAPFNLGNAYYNKETYSEAFGRFKQAGELAEAKPEKHKAYHNMGNVFMKRKEYEKAVEAYKEALRNNPKDEETRYNLALAKEMLKKQQDEQKQNDENKDNKDQEDKKDEQEKNQDQKEDGDKEEDENEEKEDEGDKGDEKEEENKEGEGDQKDEQEKEPEEQQPPRPNQLSKQQIQNLLDAMQNEEK
ncbi:MAG: tetratricopeptide repeat protein, partial [Aurantibacter sp.]